MFWSRANLMTHVIISEQPLQDKIYFVISVILSFINWPVFQTFSHSKKQCSNGKGILKCYLIIFFFLFYPFDALRCSTLKTSSSGRASEGMKDTHTIPGKEKVKWLDSEFLRHAGESIAAITVQIELFHETSEVGRMTIRAKPLRR